ncbi:hypothetical protein [Chryseobacterium cucumeris]|uniref:hypothetical protein n=1 Tax=Chryseobacterium cucumeris TaxID=1813611 RepID=UPI0024575933|nr:hypothetical protein [Chryseobacterium cucumeris]MDH5032276.1 hypothetical protein [Chryseobacterium cucumeris]
MKNLETLTNSELLTFNGGDGFWYDIAYAAGAIAREYARQVALAGYYASAGH